MAMGGGGEHASMLCVLGNSLVCLGGVFEAWRLNRRTDQVEIRNGEKAPLLCGVRTDLGGERVDGFMFYASGN